MLVCFHWQQFGWEKSPPHFIKDLKQSSKWPNSLIPINLHGKHLKLDIIAMRLNIVNFKWIAPSGIHFLFSIYSVLQQIDGRVGSGRRHHFLDWPLQLQKVSTSRSEIRTGRIQSWLACFPLLPQKIFKFISQNLTQFASKEQLNLKHQSSL